MNDPLSALGEPPDVRAVEGEGLIMGERVSVAYTPDPAVVIAEPLIAAAREAKNRS